MVVVVVVVVVVVDCDYCYCYSTTTNTATTTTTTTTTTNYYLDHIYQTKIYRKLKICAKLFSRRIFEACLLIRFPSL